MTRKISRPHTTLSALLTACIGLAGCSSIHSGQRPQQKSSTHCSKECRVTASEKRSEDEFGRTTSDPIEPLNRVVFAFNDQVLTRFLFRPLAKGTEFLLPKPVLTGLGNFFDNLQTPVRFAGALLQGDLKKTSQETGKLLINSTAGVGGFLKPSDKIPALANVPPEDVGQAFGKWGIPPGPYLVVPVIGPSSLRDLPGRAVDTALSPTFWFGSTAVQVSANVAWTVEENPKRIKAYDFATGGALDKYIVVREGYTDNRAEAVRR